MIQKKIMMDPGHGGSDPGVVANGLVEKNMVMVTTRKAKAVLEANGQIVKLTRESDVYVDINERARMANEWGADYFISDHYNGGGGDGAEAIYSIHPGEGQALSNSILDSIRDTTGQNLRRAYTKAGQNGDYFGVIRETRMTAVIVEPGFVDSDDRFILDSIEEQEAIGTAIAMGILKHIGASYVPVTTPVGKPEEVINAKKQTWEFFVQGFVAQNLQKAANSVYGPKLAVDGFLGDRSWSLLDNVLLTKGTQNQIVKVVQERLLQLGYRLPQFGADGWYGDESIAAIRSFQQARGLSVDGIAGPKTLRALFSI
jgi:N-acetylmuramoyl-L-alanine amidase